ncbi:MULTISPECIES: helix-turn-helix transcriptional regulator [Yersinia]|uniref:helix-turn-helix transcriptional regulator n=1 Tax=Yersinia TaxID=629 RepID=UPI0005DE2862|nr:MULTISPECIES: AlpA family phage regulatory protein [Yersinia]CNL27908.1 phage transcriptional regulator AlpA [Yersinia frederiksenii]
MPRILRIKDVAKKVGVSVSTLYDWLSPKSRRYAPAFPKQFSIGISDRGAKGWDEAEIDSWIEQRKNQRPM